MKFSELAQRRQSNRKYKDQPVEKEKILQCIETARLAPSANNSQPWKFVVIEQKELKEKVANCCNSLWMNKFSNQAPIIVAVVHERQNILSSIGNLIKHKDYSQFDIGIAVNQFCLQAADLGLGTCIIGWFNEKGIKKLLNIPRYKRIALMISLGYSDASIRPKARKSIEEMSSWNGYK